MCPGLQHGALDRARGGSALSQTYPSLEVVVVDDASTDGTLERVRELHDPRIRLYSNSRNLGHSGNWNRSLSLARGRLIKFLCADDVLYPDCLEAMVALFTAHPSIGLVFSLRGSPATRNPGVGRPPALSRASST
jgi:glycosyltransferase involved in cell wall biosynthesis